MASLDAASGRTSEKLSLSTLQSKMKFDPEGYSSELILIYSQFKSSLELFKQQAALNFTSLTGVAADTTVAKDLGDRAMFLAHVTPFYPKELAQFPNELLRFMEFSSRNLRSGLRVHVVQALILLINRKIIDIADTLAVFIDLQTMGDRALKKLSFSHVVHSIRRMNQKHRNDPRNRGLQNILFGMLQQEEEEKAKRALITLCDLHRRKVWFDERTADAICMACFHPSSRIMIAALSFLLDFEKIEDDDDSDNEDEPSAHQSQVVLNKEAVYKANHKGTTSSKKKKKAKLQRVMRSMKKQQQRLSSEKTNSNSYYSPLNHLKDAQGFSEKLFSRLQSSNERFEVKMMMLKVVARIVGLHRLILLNFYPFLQKYVQPHQRDITSLLAAAVQACHDMVPPDAVEPLFRQIVNQFVHDRSRPEAISVGLNAVREICLRMPLLMTEDLLQDLVLYKKSHEKAVSSAARSLLTLFREVCPSLLVKKDRGRPADPKARPKAFGEVHVPSNIPGIEFLEHGDDTSSAEDINEDGDTISNDRCNEEDGSNESDTELESAGASDFAQEADGDSGESVEETEDSDDESNFSTDDASDTECTDKEHEDSDLQETDDCNRKDTDADSENSKVKKRKFCDFEEQLNSANKSLRALKKLAGATGNVSSVPNDGILSNEDFQRIKEGKAKSEARAALRQHGFKIPSSDQLSSKRVDAAKLEANIKMKLTKDERLALIRAGREERGKYQARTAIKQKKTGGLSNRQKEHKKAMPLAAKRSKIAKTRQEKKKLKQRSGKQFRGRKAWK